VQLAIQAALKLDATFVVIAVAFLHWTYKWHRTLTDFQSLTYSPLCANRPSKREDV